VAYVGVDAGLFKKHDIDIEEIPIRDNMSAGIQALLGVDVLIGVRGLASELIAGAVECPGNAPSVSSFCETPEEAAEMLVAGAVPGDVILVKGSRGVRMEIVVERLKTAFGSAKK